MTKNDLPIIDWDQEALLEHKVSGLTHELLSILVKQLPATQQAINEAFANKNYKALNDILHKLQGSCVYCGLHRLKATIIKINHSIYNTQQVSQDLISEINQEIDIIMEELRFKGFVG